MKQPAKLSIWRIIINRLKIWKDLFILWLFVKVFVIFLTLFLSLKRYRMSHNNGIAGKGRLRILDELDIPEHEFFQAGKQFDIRIRHASATFLDDAMKVIRSCSIKFSDHHYKSPLDLECNTGHTSVFWSVVSFFKFAGSRSEKWGVDWVDYNRKYPDGSGGAQHGVRRHATSFHNLRYYTKTPFLYMPISGVKHYCNYRIRPYEDIPESGINHNPSAEDTSNQRILPHETRGRNFLKREYEALVRKEGARYKLQIQLRVATESDDPEIFNNMKPWDEKRYPWRDLATFHITETLDWRESTLTTFSMKNMPKTLGIIPAKSIYDYNSLNYLRAKSDPARRARLFAYKIWGMVPPIPDDDNRNIRVWTKPI